MRSIEMIITIIGRYDGEKFLKFYREEDVFFTCQAFGMGTASAEILSYLGIGDTEKLVLFSLTHRGRSRKLMGKLETHLRLDKPGAVAFSVPISSVGGASFLNYLAQDPEEGAKMESINTAAELVICICQKGYVDQVMDAAKAAGARGGTSIHARGANAEDAEKFFGISIQPEKELVFIVTPSEKKTPIMKSIMQHAGLTTPAKGMVFAVPVTATAGIHLQPKEKEKEEAHPAE